MSATKGLTKGSSTDRASRSTLYRVQRFVFVHPRSRGVVTGSQRIRGGVAVARPWEARPQHLEGASAGVGAPLLVLEGAQRGATSLDHVRRVHVRQIRDKVAPLAAQLVDERRARGDIEPANQKLILQKNLVSST